MQYSGSDMYWYISGISHWTPILEQMPQDVSRYPFADQEHQIMRWEDIRQFQSSESLAPVADQTGA
jgi:hypothetical protein